MKGIILLFLFVFATLGVGVYFYETEIASPRAANALAKIDKKKLKPKLAIAKVASIQAVPLMPEKQSRVVDLLNLERTASLTKKERLIKNIAIEKSISSTIKKSIRLEIQKAVVSEMGRKR
jgi:hypothetical protein